MLRPIDEAHAQKAAQVLLVYLNDPRNSTPNDMLEGVVSGKTLIRGIASGQLTVCEHVAPEKEPGGDGSPEDA